VSFNPKYPIEPSTLTLDYKTEPESLAPKAPCLGSVNEPQAEKGHLCIYSGSGVSKEPENKAAGFIGFDTPFGEAIANHGACNAESGNCQTGVLVIFRTTGWTPAPGVTAAPGYLDNRGSWAVTAN
jgi:hypothetical protein